jgi:aminopeptidase N
MASIADADGGGVVATVTPMRRARQFGRVGAAVVLVPVVLVPFVAASCSSDLGVTVQRADAVTASTPAQTTLPDPVVTDPVEPTDPAGPGPVPAPETSPPPGESPDGVGDALYPSLGNPGIDVRDYDITLTYDPAGDTIVGSVTISLDATADRAEFTLDVVDLTIDAVRVDGVDATFVVEPEELRITPAAPLVSGSSATVEIEYHGAPDAGGGFGLPNGWFHTDSGSYVLNEPDGARTWLPSNDHPSDKATFTFRLTVPAGTTAVANGALVSSDPSPDGGSTWTWREDEPMATYLVQLLTGDYQVIEAESPGGVPLLSVVLRSDVDAVQPCLDSMGAQIDFFETFFGPYPLDRYGIAVTDSFGGLAMETQGRSLFSREDLVPCTLNPIQELLLSHELAHQWFGDAVTPAQWQDIWLNESFATYAQWLWLAEVGIESVDSAAATALSLRAQLGGNPTGLPGADDLFGYNSYDGGATVLHALRLTVGDEVFFDMLRRWVADNEGTSRTTADFIALAESESGMDLGDFFATWLYSRVIPIEFPAQQ